ncbi:MAG: class I SAM-dependent methyltransferase [Elusimicrobia bacterium]|nr:class I SAM-dependent methyltransferase [Elusimicrobiota bacterium]
MDTGSFEKSFSRALDRRKALLETLHAEGTDCYRLFHGISEGWPGLAIDRYGPLILLQTFRESLAPGDLGSIEEVLRGKLPHPFDLACNHRGEGSTRALEEWRRARPESPIEIQCKEFGLSYLIRARHRGLDPWLFLDLRPGRRFLKAAARGMSVLNLFSYTCGSGVCAAAGGANEVWNVDFASSNLEIGRRNALLNGIPEARFRVIEEDCLAVLRQLAGIPVGRRGVKAGRYQRFEPRLFDLVFLDPPAWSKGPFGAVDVAGDYPSLFKPAVLSAKPGGRVIATNHVPTAGFDTWVSVLARCAAKAGRPVRSLQRLEPEGDFPSFDGQPPLKIVVCEV